ncbi:hypothetical protein KM043_008222 [Ampulex compressa]|nr:hypothetical protein KM043_008222 [Ampulex compressa]
MNYAFTLKGSWQQCLRLGPNRISVEDHRGANGDDVGGSECARVQRVRRVRRDKGGSRGGKRRGINRRKVEREETTLDDPRSQDAATVQSHCTPMPRCAPCPRVLRKESYCRVQPVCWLGVFFIDNERKQSPPSRLMPAAQKLRANYY